MFNFFVALFGSAYYIGRCAHEKSKSNAYYRSEASRKASRDYIESTMTTSPQHEQDIKDYINSGDNYEEICEKFEEDFRFVFGPEWKSLLRIPPKPPVLDPKTYKGDAYSFWVPANHIYWVYHLILASEGKVDRFKFSMGYSIGGPTRRDMQIKFSQCIERRLHEAGKADMILVYEEDTQQMKFQSLSCYPHTRLW